MNELSGGRILPRIDERPNEDLVSNWREASRIKR